MRVAWFAVCIVSAITIGAVGANLKSLDSVRRRTANVAVTQIDQGQRLAEINERVAALSAPEAASPRPAVDLKGQSRKIAIERADSQSFTPVSMTPIGEGLFLISNYRNIYVFDEKKAEAYPIKLDKPVPVWNPTAVHYSPYYDRVFIANYTGNDVIIATLDRTGERITMKLDERLTHPKGIIGTEGIDLSKGGRYMAVASYDGGSISLFERSSNRWNYRWTQPVVSAHGVAIVGDHVYGSGTTIAKFEIATGREVARVSSIGGRPVLFTTCLDHDERTGDLIASDTMAGRVFTLTRDLVQKGTFGANGPGFSNLSMPYCVYRDARATYLLSTYQERVIRIDERGTTSFEFAKGDWAYAAALPQSTYSPEIWRGVDRVDSPGYDLFGRTIRPSYGALMADDETTLVMPSSTSLLTKSWLYYVTSIAQDGEWLIIAANSSPYALLINRETAELASVELPEQDCWATAHDLTCPSKRYSLADLKARANFFHPRDLPEILKAGGDKAANVLSELKSEGGLKLKADPSRHQAQEYLKWAKGRYLPLLEYWVAFGLAAQPPE